jgi:hypothetical protein
VLRPFKEGSDMDKTFAIMYPEVDGYVEGVIVLNDGTKLCWLCEFGEDVAPVVGEALVEAEVEPHSKSHYHLACLLLTGAVLMSHDNANDYKSGRHERGVKL